jgi:hypothetical protein
MESGLEKKPTIDPFSKYAPPKCRTFQTALQYYCNQLSVWISNFIQMRNFTNPPKKDNLPQAQIDYDDAIDKHTRFCYEVLSCMTQFLTFTGYKPAFDER